MLSRLKAQAVSLQGSLDSLKEQCARCKQVQLTYNLSHCPVCHVHVCPKCTERVSVLDTSVLDPRWKGTPGSSLAVCAEPCAGVCAAANAKKFRSEMTRTFTENVRRFLEDDEDDCYARPGAAVTATDAGATARRVAPLAKKALELTGYAAVVQYAHLVLEAGSVAALVLSPQAQVLCDRVMPILRRHFFPPPILNNAAKDGGDDNLDERDSDDGDSAGAAAAKDDEDSAKAQDTDSSSKTLEDDEDPESDATAAAKHEASSSSASSGSGAMAWGAKVYQRAAAKLPGNFETKRYATEATELALRLYYFGCATAVERLVHGVNCDSLSTRDDLRAPDALLDRAGDEGHVGPATWLYASRNLRAPHDEPDWGAWYASRLARRGGFALLACVGASRSETALAVPTRRPVPFPAWCLAADRTRRVAVLAVRGSATHSDWLVNSDAEPVPVFSDDDDDDRARWGHGGIVKAARAILDDCGARRCLVALAAKGYSIRTVGHSLGAGVATLVAAILRHDEGGLLREVTCVAYAPPACVDEDLAGELDPAVLSVAHRDDLVPRLSDANCARLAKDLVADDANYRARLAADKASIKTHVATLGKVAPMRHRDDLDAAKGHVSASASTTTTPPKPAGEEEEDEDERRRRQDILRLVPPGKILYLTTRDATYEALAGRYAALRPELARIVVSSKAVDDHMMPAHLAALRSARWARGNVPRPSTPPRFRRGVDPASGDFVPCYCCGSDTTWTSWTGGSDAARAAATHHCRGCGNVVCAFCAPAGDEVAGDGIGQKLRLPDLRISLPSFGYFEPVRVCRPCSFAAYTL